MRTNASGWLGGWMSRLGGAVLLMAALMLGIVVGGRAAAQTVVFEQPADPAGGQYKSAWYDPDGLNDDAYVWDAFTLGSNTAITEIRWRGAYTNYLSGAGKAPVYKFKIGIYGSIAANSQPDIIAGPIVRFTINSNAGETAAGIAGGVQMYDYHYTLSSPFQAAAGVKYWVQIEASQGVTPTYGWPPDWSIAKGTGGDGSHFRKVGGTGGNYTFISGDCAFALVASSAPSAMISASVSPVGAGSILGAGVYPIGSVASLTANANAGYGFLRWTENGNQVSANAHYTFTVSANRTLVANYAPAFTITAAAWPTYGGSVTGGGVYNEGTTVTVTATPNPGYVFSGWTEFGNPVSMSTTYSFPAVVDTTLTANFDPDPLSAAFDFNDGPQYTSLPVGFTSNGLSAVLSGGYSIQAASAMGFTPQGFSGLCVYPNSVFGSDLTIDFSRPIVNFSIMYAPQELGCDDSARMRATGYRNGVQVGTNTTTAPVPGTWPTGTLTLAVPGGCDRVVVHYDHRPPTCQDYGVIFLADNMTVTMACVPAGVSSSPAAAVGCASGGGAMVVTGSGNGLGYQWQIADAMAPSGWVDLVDGDNVLPSGGSFGAVGSWTNAVWIVPPSTSGVVQLGTVSQLRCVVSNSCGSATSDPATLTICVADVNCDLIVDLGDFFQFFNDFDQTLPGADVNGDYVVDLGDFFAFFNAFDQSC